MSLRFPDRETAGELLAERLRGRRWPAPPVVLALARGGIPVAVPVAPPEAVAQLQNEVDELVCLSQPAPFHAIGLHYADFHQIEDAEVLALLGPSAPAAGSDRGRPRGPSRNE
jgi:predicted phosphoribosyltransferase